jgi:curved DNA-binding protein CbpA
MLMDRETQAGPDLYKVLNVDPGADAEVIRAAYKALARRDHPDVSADPAASSKMAELNAAFEVLRDPERRGVYDQSRRALAAPTDTPTGPQGTAPANGPARPVVNGQPPSPRAAARGSSGTILDFGRYAGWSLPELARHDPDYLEWLARTMIGHAYQEEIERLLALSRPRPLSVPTPAHGRKGWFGRFLG